MTPTQFCVLQVPDEEDEAWRRALFDVAIAKGWKYYEEWAGETIALDPDAGGLMLTGADTATSLPPEQWVVITTSPQHAVSTIGKRYGVDEKQAIIQASDRFAMADALVKRGSLLASSQAAVITIPGLEPAKRADHSEYFLNAEDVSPAGVDGPLAFYQQLPVSETAKAWWPASMLTYPGSHIEETDDGVCVTLVGRRRLLTQGPHIMLPAGRWVLTTEITLDSPVAVALRIEWGSSVLEPTLRANGKYEIRMVTDQPERFRSDLSIQLLVPVLHGEMTLHGSWLERQA